ncbi:hypothetical protein J7T55_013752 [Diaporthe amygdali]|uniref:uncharacterized protein n=1 Tax=Phomopsis amygdali TaxID=1214568 RepID=UPI0022FEF9FF|nr:uncharacterized protein J7T55_013752 [Diaporthe amygdali]KAJ0119549.1 hypothetical protein J7T55_013752 [Diaporthe amygdali]
MFSPGGPQPMTQPNIWGNPPVPGQPFFGSAGPQRYFENRGGPHAVPQPGAMPMPYPAHTNAVGGWPHVPMPYPAHIPINPQMYHGHPVNGPHTHGGFAGGWSPQVLTGPWAGPRVPVPPAPQNGQAPFEAFPSTPYFVPENPFNLDPRYHGHI